MNDYFNLSREIEMVSISLEDVTAMLDLLYCNFGPNVDRPSDTVVQSAIHGLMEAVDTAADKLNVLSAQIMRQGANAQKLTGATCKAEA